MRPQRINLKEVFRKEREIRGSLNNRALIKLKLRTEGPLHLGGGEEELLEVVINGERYLYVPQSSIKGSLRKLTELMARASSTAFNGVEELIVRSHCEVEGRGLRHVCTDRSALNEIVREIGGDLEILRLFVPPEDIDLIKDLLSKGHDKGLEALEPFFATLCPICRLWGGRGLKGKVIIRDTLIRKYRTAGVTRVGIDRFTLTRKERILFTPIYGYLLELPVEIIVDNVLPGTSDAKLLAALLEYLSHVGMELGGLKSVGLGHLTLVTEDSKVYYADFRSCGNSSCLKALANLEDKEFEVSLRDYINLLRNPEGS